MRNFVLRVFINAVALWVAAQLIAGISLDEAFWPVLLVAVVFGVVNALIRPLVLLLSLPLVVLTLGLFTLVVNALMLLLTAALVPSLSVEGFLAAFLGAVVISVVSLLLSVVLPGKD